MRPLSVLHRLFWIPCSSITTLKKLWPNPEFTISSTQTWPWSRTALRRWASLGVPASFRFSWLFHGKQQNAHLKTWPTLCVCVCGWLGDCMAECSRWPDTEEPCDRAAEVSRFSGSSRGAARGETLCRVRPQERRLSGGILRPVEASYSPSLWVSSKT